jgi:hypothetical protein
MKSQDYNVKIFTYKTTFFHPLPSGYKFKNEVTKTAWQGEKGIYGLYFIWGVS